MKLTILKAPSGGTIRAIPSKSAAHRYLICAGLSEGTSRIEIEKLSDDIEATADCLRALGANVSYENGRFTVTPGSVRDSIPVLNCRESGSTLRFLLPVAAALGGAEFRTEGRLSQRPLDDLINAIEQHGVSVTRSGDVVTVSGKMKGGDFFVPGDVSSQYVSGLLLALPLCGGGRVVLTSGLQSSPYVEMTVDAMRRFGVGVIAENNNYTVSADSHYRAAGLCVPGDWSNAAYWLCSGVSVSGLDAVSLQGDKEIVRVLENMGAAVVNEDGRFRTSGLGSLCGVKIDARDIPDAVPVISVLCAAAKGRSEISGVDRLRLKESDRVESVIRMLSSLGGVCEYRDGSLIVCGKGAKLRGGTVDSANDHRIAMSAGVAKYYSDGPVTVIGADAVGKSYPGFWNDYEDLGGITDV